MLPSTASHVPEELPGSNFPWSLLGFPGMFKEYPGKEKPSATPFNNFNYIQYDGKRNYVNNYNYFHHVQNLNF